MSKRVELTWTGNDNLTHSEIVNLPEGHEEIYIEGSDDAPGCYMTIDKIADDLVERGYPRVLFVEDDGTIFGLDQNLIISIVHM